MIVWAHRRGSYRPDGGLMWPLAVAVAVALALVCIVQYG